MIVTVDLDHLAAAARAEVERHAPRTAERRAAAALWVALTDTSSIDAARHALTGFAAPDIEHAALQLLHQLAARTHQEATP